MASRVDLHTHTTVSDGTLTPRQLWELAARLEVRVLAVTDHDTTDGYTAIAASLPANPVLSLIPAIEVSAEGESACHVLGYFIDPSNAPLQAALAQFRQWRITRVTAMADKLSALGVPIELPRVFARAEGGTIGRPHLADALIEKGYVKSRQDAFDRFLKRDGPAFVPGDKPSAADCIQLIRRAGGIPVLAHPSYYTSQDLVRRLVEMGLMGIEAYYPEHSRSLTRRYLELAQTHGLVATGGSDFHGPRTGRDALARVDVPETVIGDLERARSKVSNS